MMEFLSGLMLIAFIVWQQRFIYYQNLHIDELKNKVKALQILDAYGISPDFHKFGDEVEGKEDKDEQLS